MLKLVAIAPADGWAFVQRGAQIGLVRPPYSEPNFTEVSDQSVQAAIEKYGFESLDHDFADWASLLNYLRERLSEEQADRAAKHLSDFAPDILDSAPKDLKIQLLNRIKRELISNGEWEPALVLLKALQHSAGTMEDVELRNDVLLALSDCAEGILACDLKRRKLLEETEVDLAARFPLLGRVQDAGAVKKLAQRVEKKHQIFEVGAG